MTTEFDDPFDFYKTKQGKLRVFRNGKLVKILGVADSERFFDRIHGKDEYKVQIELARVTGNYKRGNERKK